jgi:hypothetical protein
MTGQQEFTSRSAFCDLQPVYDCTTSGTFKLLEKQLKSAGCKTLWECYKDSNINHTDDTQDQEQEEQPTIVRSYIYTADGGSDQIGYKKVCNKFLEKCRYVLFIAVPCYMHANQLVVKGGLSVIDKWAKDNGKTWGYFSSLAKLCHIWRDAARLIYLTWVQFHGAESGWSNARVLIPKCVAGRWGSIADTEKRLQEVGHDLLKQVLTHVLCSSVGAEGPVTDACLQ